ncbi:TPA: hypothetical protein N0F65_003842 [Lagenidium giganteum]|uniref:COX assembly mitochondrial protein n=1 Tax=Lagenidium giganteum TaxID=4803 RepID=A0AAV2YU29_9STRA|nr:TPA: hypothetical protein N0F65_003842 [Lagenidium giganteum]
MCISVSTTASNSERCCKTRWDEFSSLLPPQNTTDDQSPACLPALSTMHPPLERPHPDCQEVIHALYECHEENPWGKFMGACNDQKRNLDMCLKKEKDKRRIANLEHARASDAYVRQKMKERKERLAKQSEEQKADN